MFTAKTDKPHTKTLIVEMCIILLYNIIIRTINIPTVGLKSTKFLALLAFHFLFDIFYVTAECKRYSQTSVIERFCCRLSRFPTKKFEISSSFLSSCHEKATEALFIQDKSRLRSCPCFQVFRLNFASNFFNLVLVRFHQAEILVVKRLT